jgi:Flp pilus assembly protein TadB
VTVLAAASGGAVASGLVLLVAGVRWRFAERAAARPRRARPLLTAHGLRLLVLGLAAALATEAITGWPVAGLGAGAAVVFLPRLAFARADRRRTDLMEGLEQWVRRLADTLAAGRGLEDALETSARAAPDTVAGPVAALARRLSSRMGTEQALRAFAAEIDDPAGDRIAAALIIATGQRGGRVHAVLAALAELLAADVAGRREIAAERAQHRTAVRWIAGFILGFSAFAVVNKAYSAPYGTPGGELVLAVIGLLYATGLGWLHRLATLPRPGRFLDPEWPAATSGVGLR